MRVQVISPAEAAERAAAFRTVTPRVSRDEFEQAELEQRGTALFVWWPVRDGRETFSWLCPGCGRWHYGQIGDKPVSGWDNPRWVNSGTREAPSLTPSLGLRQMEARHLPRRPLLAA